jgi:hypothetical protein
MVVAVKLTSIGPAPSEAVTSKGVGLRQGLDQLIKAYGCRYQTEYDKRMSEESSTVVFTFEDESELRAGLSDDGKTIALQIMASVE